MIRASLLALVVVAAALGACSPAASPLLELPPDAGSPCAPGYVPDGDGCRDVNECAIATDTCAEAAICDNLPGSYSCRCPQGYVGDGQSCTDVDECAGAGAAACPAGRLCSNLPGGYTCACPAGTELRGDECEPLGQLIGSIDRVCTFHEGTLRCHDDDPMLALTQAQGGWRGGARRYHVGCALDASGQAYCAGTAAGGRIGDGGSQGTVPARAVSGAHHFVQIDVGESYTCAIDDATHLWCWGHLSENLPDALEPMRLPGEGWTQVSADRAYSCALRVDGSMWCWGDHVQGTPSTGQMLTEVKPERVGTGRWRSVRARDGTACALAAEDASLWCWGEVMAMNQIWPQPVRFDTSAWRDIDVEISHVCGVRVDGSLACMGWNEWGQLGPLAPYYAPTAVDVDDRHDYREVRIERDITCATRRDGSVWCFGDLDRGALSHAGQDSPVPLQLGTAHDYTAVDAANGNACAVHAGVVECWGYTDDEGPDTLWTVVPTPLVDQPPGVVWQAVATHDDSVCAQSTLGDVWCRGPSAGFAPRIRGFVDEADGLGGGLCGFDLADTLVCPSSTTGLDVRPGDWRDLTSDSRTTCAIDAQRHLYCWGANDYGQLGDGTIEPRSDVFRTGGDAEWLTVRSPGFEMCALRADGSLWCWGLPPVGGVRTVPTELRPGDTFTALSAGPAATCAIRDDASLWCWGQNYAGGLGLGQDDDYQTAEPQRVGSDTWRQVSCGGGNFTCGIHTDGTLWCWGDNTYYSLGQGSLVSYVPVQALPPP